MRSARFCLWIVLAFLPGWLHSQDLIEVSIDRRFELMSIVFRLAEFTEYRNGTVADYNDAVDTHFGPFKTHAAVVMARGLRQSVAYDAIPNLAVRVHDAANFAPLRPLEDPAAGLDPRWKPDVAAAFLKAMAAFAKDAGAEAFFAAQESSYRAAIASCREGSLRHLDQNWFDRTFGKRDRNTFTLCVAMLNGGGNYGASALNGRGGEDLYAFIGTRATAKGQVPVFSRDYLGTLVHEFLHSFLNSWVDRHLPDLKAAGDALNAPVIDQMRQQAYGNGSTALRESMVRAFTIRYFRDLGFESEAQAEEREHDQRGFYWVKDLASLLAEYTSHRTEYPVLESFTPKLVVAFTTWGAEAAQRAEAWQKERTARADALYANGPKLVSMEPADGATDVDPGTAVIRLRFDRPMKSSMALMRVDGVFPDRTGQPAWDTEWKVLLVPVSLKPETAYRFGLNGEDIHGFQDLKGVPLRPIVVGFRTRRNSGTSHLVHLVSQSADACLKKNFGTHHVENDDTHHAYPSSRRKRWVSNFPP
jgi:hypothetical protein